MNTVPTDVFTSQLITYDWITSTENSTSRCKDNQEYLIDKDSWSILIGGISLDYDDKLNKLVLRKSYSSISAF